MEDIITNVGRSAPHPPNLGGSVGRSDPHPPNLGGSVGRSDPQPPNLGGSVGRSDPQPPNLGGSGTYILQHIDPEPEYLHRLWRATNLQLLNGRMASGHLQGRLLKMLVQMIRPHYVLEVGTFSGYSAISMAEGLEGDGQLYTFEIDDELEDFTRPWIEGSDVADRIHFIIGDANIEAPRLGITFDMAFIDGDKRTYCETYETVLGLLCPGGYILADNTLWDGHVTDPAYDRDHQTQGIRRFNDLIKEDRRIEKVILPLRDGLTIIRKNDYPHVPNGVPLHQQNTTDGG